MTQKTSTTSVVQTSLNEVPMIPRQVQPSSEVPSKTPLHHMTSVSQSQPQTSSHSKDLPKQAISTGIVSQTTTELPSTTTIKITPNVLHNRSEQSNLSQSSNGRVTNAQSHSVLQDFKLTSIPAKTSSTILKESTTHPHRENHPTYVGSTRLNENSTVPLAEHQSYWTVKSTIVTAYRQGVGELAGPTVVSKVISEASATSASDTPLKTMIKEISAKRSNEHFAWLFEKVFTAITYTIGLCYLLFLVALGRSKNSNIIHGNGTTVRNVASTSSTNHGNRMKKDLQ